MLRLGCLLSWGAGWFPQCFPYCLFAWAAGCFSLSAGLGLGFVSDSSAGVWIFHFDKIYPVDCLWNILKISFFSWLFFLKLNASFLMDSWPKSSAKIEVGFVSLCEKFNN